MSFNILRGGSTNGSMKIASQRHLLWRPKSSLNQNRNSVSVSPSLTPTSISTSALAPSLRLAPIPSFIQGASVRGAHSRYLNQFHLCLIFFPLNLFFFKQNAVVLVSTSKTWTKLVLKG
jgi:hypothetical protein